MMETSYALGLGIRSILHKGYAFTCVSLAALGLPPDEGGLP